MNIYVEMRNHIRAGEYQDAIGKADTILSSNESGTLKAETQYQLSRVFAKLAQWPQAMTAIQEAKKLKATDITWQTKMDTKAAVYTFSTDSDKHKEVRKSLNAIVAKQLEYYESSFETLQEQDKLELSLAMAKTKQAKVKSYLIQPDFDNAKTCAIDSLCELRSLLGKDHPKLVKAYLLAGEVYTESAKSSDQDKVYAERMFSEARRIGQLHPAQNIEAKIAKIMQL